MKNVLVIGGTKYLGLELINILDKSKINFFVASRKKIEVNNFIKIDRKSQNEYHFLQFLYLYQHKF